MPCSVSHATSVALRGDTARANNIYTIVNPVRQTTKAAGFTAYYKNFKFGYVPDFRNLLRLIASALAAKMNFIFTSFVFKQCHHYFDSAKAVKTERIHDCNAFVRVKIY